MAEEDSCATQLINGEGEFNVAGLETFTQTVKLSKLGLSYAVVAIIGPQSSGKSTLLNHLFHTNFKEMDAGRGRSQTTKGIWIARAVGIAPCTVIMDVEGSDGKERGKKDETAFEKQSALFALAVSDVLLINMWCHDIGREQAANRPLLKTVFQVMMQLFSPSKTTLLFVIRDKSKTPLEYLEASLREDIEEIWDTAQKPQAFKDTPLSYFFNVEVTALSSYEEKEDQFKEQVGQLRQQFFNSIAPGGLAGDRRGVVPASAFAFSSEKIWKDIKENRDLDLPSHRVMLASIRCDEIGREQLMRLTSDESWLSLEEAVLAGQISGFCETVISILETYLSEYDTMTVYYDENVRKEKRQEFESKAMQVVHPGYVIFLQHVRSETLESFKMGLKQALDKEEKFASSTIVRKIKMGLKQAFNKREGFASSVRKCTQACMLEFDSRCAGTSVRQAKWDASKIRGKLQRDMEAHASAVRGAKLEEIVFGYEKLLDEALVAPVEALFETIGEHTWASIRKLLKRETDAVVARFPPAISGFELDHSILDNLVTHLRYYARSVVEKKSKEEAWKVLIRMKERFSTVFNVRRGWTEKEDIGAIREDARSASLKVLVVMAVIRLDEKSDEVEKILFSSLMDGIGTTDLLASSSWEEVPPEKTLITPIRCKSLWKEFKAETKDAVTQAISAQEAYIKKLARHHLPSEVLSQTVGITAGVVTSLVGTPFLGVPVGRAVTKSVSGALGVPDAADTKLTRLRNQAMGAETD